MVYSISEMKRSYLAEYLKTERQRNPQQKQGFEVIQVETADTILQGLTLAEAKEAVKHDPMNFLIRDERSGRIYG